MRDRLDELLDQAVATYIETPRPGLEQRVIYRVRTRTHPVRYLSPLTAAAALACLALFFPRPNPITTQVGQTSVCLPIPTTPPTKPAPARPRPRALPKQPTFPMSSPLTEGERALLKLTQQHPDTAVTVAANLKKTNSDLEIEPLDIPPLKTETGQ